MFVEWSRIFDIKMKCSFAVEIGKPICNLQIVERARTHFVSYANSLLFSSSFSEAARKKERKKVVEIVKTDCSGKSHKRLTHLR